MPPFARSNSEPTFHDPLASLGIVRGLDWQYTYDDLDRLTRARAGTLSGGSITSETRDQNWTLDHAGNWGNTTFDLNADDVYTGGGEYDWDFTQNKANEITGWDNQSNNVAPVYDAAGNMTDDQRDWQYEYDAWYRLVTVRAQNDDIVAEFKYNGLGHRISARYNETAPWFHFAYDERWRMVAMYEDDAATDVPTEQFWHHNAGPSGFGGSSYIDDVVLRDRATGGGDEGTLDERRYYLQNWHHDVVALVDTSGAIVERANYDGYGMPIGTFTSGGNGNRRGYAGYEIDPELAGHWHVRHRVLRSDLGVWTRRDPLGMRAGISRHNYCDSNPPRHTDARGREPELVSNIARVESEPPGQSSTCIDGCCVCELTLCCYELTKRGRFIGATHCFIHYVCTDSAEERVCSAGPAWGPTGGPRGIDDLLPDCNWSLKERIRNPFGPMNCYCGPFGPGNRDYDYARDNPNAVRCRSLGTVGCGAAICLEETCSRLDRCCIPYKIFGPNSNTGARFLLEECTEIPSHNQPPMPAVGWNSEMECSR